MQRVDGKRLRHARLRARLTQAALADKAGVHDSTISNLERGRYQRTQDIKLYAIADALGIDLEQLLEPPRLQEKVAS